MQARTGEGAGIMSYDTAVLKSTNGARISLESVDVRGIVKGLFLKVDVCHVYRNLDDIDTGAVFTLPIPLNAVLLDFTLELGGRKYEGVILPEIHDAMGDNDDNKGSDSVLLLWKTQDLHVVVSGTPGHPQPVSWLLRPILSEFRNRSHSGA